MHRFNLLVPQAARTRFPGLDERLTAVATLAAIEIDLAADPDFAYHAPTMDPHEDIGCKPVPDVDYRRLLDSDLVFEDD